MTDKEQLADWGTESDAGAQADMDISALVKEYSEPAFRLAASIVRDKTLAEDVVQDALVKAWLALPKFRGEGSIKAWILSITYNTAVSALRARRAILMDPHEMPEPHSKPDSVEASAQSNVVYESFVEALGALDELSRSVIVLREIEGMSYGEIAEIMDVPLPTVKTRLLRSRRTLSVALAEWTK